MFTLQTLRQSGYDILVKRYTQPNRASQQYLMFMREEYKEALMKELGLKLTSAQIMERNTKMFEKQNAQVFNARRKNK